MTAIPMVDDSFGPAVWQIRKMVKAIMPNHAMTAPQYGEVRGFDLRERAWQRKRTARKTKGIVVLIGPIQNVRRLPSGSTTYGPVKRA